MTRIRRFGLLGAVAGTLTLLAGLFAIVSPASSSSATTSRICGVPPGDGAYSYIKTRNVSCRIAQRVGNKAVRKFCRRPSKCRYDPLVAGKVYKGRVRSRGWPCKVKVGWEYVRVKCERKNRRFVKESAS